MLCEANGVAYQADISRSVPYDIAYFEKYAGYEGTPIANRINDARLDMVALFGDGPLLDVGIGSGEFLKARNALGCATFGVDINPVANAWLRSIGRFSDEFESFLAFTFWDVLEHCEDPSVYLSRVPVGALLFTCIPVFEALDVIRKSKHYRPDEHYYYWTRPGFADYMYLRGFDLLLCDSREVVAGREEIGSFAFRKARH